MVSCKVRKPKAILFDMNSAAVKQSFNAQALTEYFHSSLKQYLEENWDSAQEDIERLRQHSPGLSIIPKSNAAKEDIINGVVEYVLSCAESGIENKAILMLRFHVWHDAFQRGQLETPVYSDVAIQIQKWRCDMNIRLFVYSSKWSEASKCFLSKTNHGNLSLLIDAFYDTTTVGAPNKPETYTTLLQLIKYNSRDVLFLTKSPEEARAANQAGITTVLVIAHRKDLNNISEDDRGLPRIRTYNELDFE